MSLIAAGCAPNPSVALGLTDFQPVRGTIAGAGKPPRIDESLSQQERCRRLALPLSPANPALARGTVPSRRLPAQQGQLLLAEHGDLAQTLPAQLAESEIVLGPHQGIPARFFLAPDGAHAHRPQGNRIQGHSGCYRASSTSLSTPPRCPLPPRLAKPSFENPWYSQGLRCSRPQELPSRASWSGVHRSLQYTWNTATDPPDDRWERLPDTPMGAR